MRGVAITLACFALVAALLAWSQWLARRRLASLGHATLAAACASLAAFLWLVTHGLEGYGTIQPGMAIAELRFDEVAPGRYRATLVRLPEGRVQVFEMPGELWRIEARTLAWLAPAASLGLAPAYRLERFESGSAGGPTGGTRAGHGYPLADEAGTDVWARAHDSPLWSRYAAAGVAGTPWQPMADGTEFSVMVAAGHLVVEPAGPSGPVLAPQDR